MPASQSARARCPPTSTASGAGLRSTALPAASAASTPPAGIESGKFHGGATTTTPSGSMRAPSTLVARAERARVVAGEVDRLRHLRIRLGHRLGAVDDHRADQVAAPPGEHGGGAVEERAPLLGRTGRPRRLGDAGRVERAIELRAVGEPVTVGDAPWA